MEPKEVQGQIALLDNSQALIRTIFLGLALQYRALDVQRELLLEPECLPCEAGAGACDPKKLQIAASLIILGALFGFWQQALQLANESAADGQCPDLTEAQLSAVIIVIALIRLFRLAAPQPTGDSAQVETEELATEPVI